MLELSKIKNFILLLCAFTLTMRDFERWFSDRIFKIHVRVLLELVLKCDKRIKFETMFEK